MSKYYLTNKAVEDLTEIWNYTVDEWSESQADKYHALILFSCSELAKTPTLGKKYDRIKKGILGHKSGEHIIFYSIVSKNEIEIARILHRMMDLRNKL